MDKKTFQKNLSRRKTFLHRAVRDSCECRGKGCTDCQILHLEIDIGGKRFLEIEEGYTAKNQPEKKTVRQPKAKVDFYKDSKKEWRWRLIASNGRVLADCGEGYKRKIDCRDGFISTATSMFAVSILSNEGELE